MDIHKFYPSIDHTVLKRTLRKKIKDAELLALLDEIIDSADGLPIGHYLSQIFANLVLGYFLHRLNERAEDSAVYMDDIVVFDESKERLHELFRVFIVPELTKIGLTVKDNHKCSHSPRRAATATAEAWTSAATSSSAVRRSSENQSSSGWLGRWRESPRGRHRSQDDSSASRSHRGSDGASTAKPRIY